MKTYLITLGIVLIFGAAALGIGLWITGENQTTFTPDEQKSIQTAEAHGASYIVVADETETVGSTTVPVVNTHYYYGDSLPQAVQEAQADNVPYVIGLGSNSQGARKILVSK